LNTKKKYFRAFDRFDQVSELREQSVTRGYFPGFDCLYEIFSLKPGYPLFIAGSPFSGKTEFALELAILTAELYGWKHFVNLGETGNVDEQIAEIAHKYIGKPFRIKTKNELNNFAMNDTEKTRAIHFINEHFVFCDLENSESKINSLSIKQFYDLADEAERELEIKFNTTIFDPFNDAEENLNDYGGREDKYLKEVLKESRISSKKNNRIDILVNHIADIKPIVEKGTGKRYTPPALPTEWAGGRTWHRRAFTMLLVYRPPTWLKNEYGEPYKENETVIYNQKAKPKGTGKIGNCSLFFDWKKNRFYEDYQHEFFAHKQGGGLDKLREDINRRALTPSKVKEDEADDSPF